MDAKAKSELESIKGELRSIITELESISAGVRSNFSGIGNETCAACIDRAISQYKSVWNKLNRLDTKTLVPGWGGQ